METSFMDVTFTKRIPESVQYALSILLGCLMGALFLLDLPTKWMVALIVVLSFALIILIIGDTKRVLLFGLTFSVPFYIGIGLPVFLQRVEHIGLSTAVDIQFIDILILALLIFRWVRLTTRQAGVRFFPSTTVPALAWFIASALSLANAKDTYIALIQLVQMGKLFLIYLVVANGLEDETDVKVLLWALLLGVFFQGLLGSYQAITGHSFGLSFLGEGWDRLQLNMGRSVAYRAYGTIGHGNSYAMYLSATMPFALALLFSGIRGFYKVLTGIVLCVGILGLVFSLSRGGWLSFGVVIIVVLVFAIRRTHHKMHVSWAIGGAMLLVMISLALSQQNLIMRRLVSDDAGAAYARITMAKGAAAMINDYPILGVGLNNYSLLMPKYDMASFAIEGLVIVHNIFLLITAEAGIIGLIAFLWLLATLLIRAWRLASGALSDTVWVAGVGIFSAYTVLTIHGMVDYAMLASAPLIRLFWLFAGATAALSAKPAHE